MSSKKSPIELYIINEVRLMREKAKMSQTELSTRLGFSEGFVGHIENPKRRDKYNIKHLNELAKIFKCSPRKFWPEDPI
jgi:transcriptional regulator with XRE-family HTH domain